MVRRDDRDYVEESIRFQDFLQLTEGKRIRDLKNEGEFIDSLDKWFRSIDVYGNQAVNFADQMIRRFAKRTYFDGRDVREKEIAIIKGFNIRRNGTSWQDGESGFLKRNYVKRNVSIGFIAKELGRSKKSVYNKAFKMGLKRHKKARKR